MVFSKKGEGEVGTATVGGFFGELALLKEETRYVLGCDVRGEILSCKR